jgi:hypothetical protein
MMDINPVSVFGAVSEKVDGGFQTVGKAARRGEAGGAQLVN